jgi:hypothetical protein
VYVCLGSPFKLNVLSLSGKQIIVYKGFYWMLVYKKQYNINNNMKGVLNGLNVWQMV